MIGSIGIRELRDLSSQLAEKRRSGKASLTKNGTGCAMQNDDFDPEFADQLDLDRGESEAIALALGIRIEVRCKKYCLRLTV